MTTRAARGFGGAVGCSFYDLSIRGVDQVSAGRGWGSCLCRLRRFHGCRRSTAVGVHNGRYRFDLGRLGIAHWRTVEGKAVGIVDEAIEDGIGEGRFYDNMKTAVDAVFVGKERAFNRRFMQLMSHHLVEPTACSPAAGWEKGQVENQVGTLQDRFFTPRLKFKTYEELNAWLLDRCIAYARAQPHPEFKDQTVFAAFEAERTALIPYRGPFDGFHATTCEPALLTHDDRRRKLTPPPISPLLRYAPQLRAWRRRSSCCIGVNIARR